MALFRIRSNSTTGAFDQLVRLSELALAGSLPAADTETYLDDILHATLIADMYANMNAYNLLAGVLKKNGVQQTLPSWSVAQDTAQTTSNLRAAAVSATTDPGFQFKFDRSIVILAVNQLNLLRERCIAQDAVIAATFTTFADLQSRWATMATAHPLPDITLSQALTAIVNKINDGSAD